MHKILLALTLLATLTACSFLHVHKMDIEQGNVITQAQVDKIHRGMTISQVKDIMGNPILTNVFDPSHADYVYTYKPGYGTPIEKHITISFRNGRADEIKGNMYSEFIR